MAGVRFGILLYHYGMKKEDSDPVAEVVYRPELIPAGYGLIQATLSVELNSAGELEFTMPVTHPKYDRFGLKLTECAVIEIAGTEEKELWRGFVSETSVDFDGSKTVKCSGIQAYLNDSVVMVSAGNYTPLEIMTCLINNHNDQITKYDSKYADYPYYYRSMINKKFTIDEVNIYDESKDSEESEESEESLSPSIYFEETNNYDITWNVIESRLFDEFGGYIKVRRGADGLNHISYTTDPGETDPEKTQEIRYGVNLLDLNFTITTEDLFTVLLPTAQSTESDGGLIEGTTLFNDTGILNYGYIVQVFNLDRTDAEDDYELKRQLMLAATKKMSKAGLVTSIEGSALDFHNIDIDVEAIKLGDAHLIYCQPTGLKGYKDDEKRTGYVSNKIEYDLLYFENSVYSFGDKDESMTAKAIFDANDIATKIAENNAAAKEAADKATAANAIVGDATTPLVVTYTLDASMNMTCNITVKVLVAALSIRKPIILSDSGGNGSFTPHAEYSVSGTSYTVSLDSSAFGRSWIGNNLSEDDTLVLQNNAT